jgi:hypothetical protein
LRHSPQIMPSVLLLPPPTGGQRIASAGTGVFTLLVAGVVLFATTRFFLESIAAPKVEVWDFVGTATGLVFAGVFCWVAWKCRLGALPFRFVADASSRECGYRWGSWWARRIDLSDATKLRGGLSYVSVRPYEGTWRWSIYALRGKFDKDVELYSSLKAYSLEEEAVMDCRRTLQVLSEHLRLPSEFTGV